MRAVVVRRRRLSFAQGDRRSPHRLDLRVAASSLKVAAGSGGRSDRSCGSGGHSDRSSGSGTDGDGGSGTSSGGDLGRNSHRVGRRAARATRWSTRGRSRFPRDRDAEQHGDGLLNARRETRRRGTHPRRGEQRGRRNMSTARQAMARGRARPMVDSRGRRQAQRQSHAAESRWSVPRTVGKSRGRKLEKVHPSSHEGPPDRDAPPQAAFAPLPLLFFFPPPVTAVAASASARKRSAVS